MQPDSITSIQPSPKAWVCAHSS